jgi:transposase
MGKEDKEQLQKQIAYLKETKNLSFRQIQDQIGISRKLVSRIYSGHWEQSAPHERKLDEYRSLIGSWYKEQPRLKAIQVFRRLKERAVDIGYTAIKDFTKSFREKPKKIYHALEFLPAEEGQVDWFFHNHPRIGKLCGFTLILSYSRFLFAFLFPRHSFEFFIEGHLLAFDIMKGLPFALRYDNLRTVVLKRQPLIYNPAFLDFARYYGFEIRLCNPASGNEKGRVERSIRSMRDTFFNLTDHMTTMKEINSALQDWVTEKNSTFHRATGKLPLEARKEEKLKNLPSIRWQNATTHPPQPVTKTGFVFFDTNRYSVPETLVEKSVSVRSFVHHIELYDTRGNQIASHPRSFERNKSILNPNHRSFRRLSSKAKRDRIYSVIRNMDPAVSQFLAQNDKIGENSFDTAYQLFQLIRNHSRKTVLSAIREAIGRKSPRLKFVASLLSPTPEPTQEPVMPQNPLLLEIDYKPRSLEEYDDE